MLDFVNTRPVQDGEPTELLEDFGAAKSSWKSELDIQYVRAY